MTISATVAIPTCEPRELRAGDTWVWNRQYPNFPSGQGWVLTYYLHGVGKLVVVAGTDPDGVTFNVVVTPTGSPPITGTLPAGAYRWEAKVSNSGTGEVYTVGEDDVTVLPNFATVATGSLQLNPEIMLAAVEGELAARFGLAATNTPGGGSSAATSPGSAHEHITIAGRELTKIPIKELYALRSKYKNEIALAENGGMLPRIAIVMGHRRNGTGPNSPVLWDGQ